MTIQKGNFKIATIEEWHRHAPPKLKDIQWRDGRSAKECARAWLSDPPGQLPPEVISLLSEHPDFGPIRSWVAEPEARLHFDDFQGEPRNTDVLVRASDAHGDYLLAVEAKADESFGQTVADALVDAVERKLGNPRSNGLARVVGLAETLFRPHTEGLPSIRLLRYQLLTATAGAIAEARRRGCGRVVVLVHEFVTDRTKDSAHKANAADLDSFVERLSGGVNRSVEPGRLVGPVVSPGKSLFEAGPALYFAKAIRNLR